MKSALIFSLLYLLTLGILKASTPSNATIPSVTIPTAITPLRDAKLCVDSGLIMPVIIAMHTAHINSITTDSNAVIPHIIYVHTFLLLSVILSPVNYSSSAPDQLVYTSCTSSSSSRRSRILLICLTVSSSVTSTYV